MTISADDRFALRELVDSYGMAVDALDVDWFSSLWAPDATLVLHEGTGEVRRWYGEEIGGMVKGVRRYLRTFHFVGNHRVHQEGDVVSGQTYCFAHHLQPGPETAAGIATGWSRSATTMSTRPMRPTAGGASPGATSTCSGARTTTSSCSATRHERASWVSAR